MCSQPVDNQIRPETPSIGADERAVITTLVDHETVGPTKLSVTYRAISELSPYKGNGRTHTKTQIRKIAESIRSFGFTNPVLVDAHDTIVAGHCRVEAAKILKLAQVPTIRLEALTPAQVRAYVIADNRLAEDAGWDENILKIELQDIILEGVIDISLTGFEVPEIDVFLGEVVDEDSADALPEEQLSFITQPGDLWLLGEHRVLCGDARSEASFAALMESRRASVILLILPITS